METNWWQITIGTTADREDILFWVLQNFGCQGMATQSQGEEIVISAYVPTETRSEAELQHLALTIAQDYDITDIKWESIPEEDWSLSWKQHWQPDPIGKNLIIYPAWIEVPAQIDRVVIRLDPGSAFGSGAHPTTRMCLEALEEVVSPQTRSIADLGCGSGILGIAAYRLGVKQIYSADLDPLAIKATRHNWELNQFPSEDLVVIQGSLGDLPPVEGFVCNILAEPILEMMPGFKQLGEWGILSGILVDQVPIINTALQAHQWNVTKLMRQEQWACLIIS
jgi:ribosomal protein L11 methyltransferase